jgi:hypothetical protein
VFQGMEVLAMGNILTATVTIEGTRPLWFHRFGPDALPLEKQERTGVAGNDPEEWRRTVSVTKDGQLCLDSTYGFATIREGSRYTKKGRGSIQSAVVATLQVTDNRILIDRHMPGFPNGHAYDVLTEPAPPQDSELPVYLDIRGVRNPATKARNVRYRIACASGWQATFNLQWDKTIVSRNEMEAAVIDAGRLAGIGNGRAVGMGRFSVVSFQVTEVA